MDPFEFIIVPVSIVLALGLGKLLAGIFELIGPRRFDWLQRIAHSSHFLHSASF